MRGLWLSSGVCGIPLLTLTLNVYFLPFCLSYFSGEGDGGAVDVVVAHNELTYAHLFLAKQSGTGSVAPAPNSHVQGLMDRADSIHCHDDDDDVEGDMSMAEGETGVFGVGMGGDEGEEEGEGEGML